MAETNGVKRLGERLIEAGLVSTEAIEQALAHQKITGHRLGDCLVELGLMPEAAMLRFLAQQFNTRFVSAEKLSKATIAPQVLERVPVRMAEAQDFMPIAFDPERKILSVVMAQPQNHALTKEIALVTEMTEVFTFVGVRSAIQAAIRKHYYGDPTAFAQLERGGVQAVHRDAEALAQAYEGSEPRSAANEIPAMRATATGRGGSSRINAAALRDVFGAARGAVSETDYLETLNVLVSLVEQPRKDFRGHSSQVARQASLIARRMGLPPRELASTAIAAQLHELGKRPDAHFTLPAMMQSPELRAEVKRLVRAPIKLFEMVHLPASVNSILAHLYEAYDGSGVPHGTKGEDIPAGSRIIAAVDAFFDLTRNPANHLGRAASKFEALKQLTDASGTLFDPVVVDTLAALQNGDLVRQRVENEGRQIVVADPDEATRTDLMDALTKVSLVVHAVAKLDSVVDVVLTGEADTIVVGLGYGLPDLLTLTQFVRTRPESASVPILVLGDVTDPTNRERLVQAGVTSFLPTPVDPDHSAVVIRGAYVDRLEHGGPGHVVRGSFDELSAAELARTLGAGHKSGRLVIRSGPAEGLLHLERGKVVYAQLADKKGEAAVAAALASPQAEFQFEPETVLTEMPNVELSLDVIARQLSAAADAAIDVTRP